MGKYPQYWVRTWLTPRTRRWRGIHPLNDWVYWVCARLCLQYSLLPASLGPVLGSLLTGSCILEPHTAPALGDVWIWELQHFIDYSRIIFLMVLVHERYFRDTNVHGCARVLPAHAPSPLGRILVEILQRRWLSLYPVLVRVNLY